ncbi:SMI1/KNR4 family protein [Paenirhodobacter sp.]|uniref:SMI1/KNR4 family protein n=1 Tax=Paenirhodobacter sp. TaxID=1965326 RepID=UPI003B3E5FBC
MPIQWQALQKKVAIVMRNGWQPEKGAAGEDLAKMVAASRLALPEDYLSFLRVSNGGQGPLPVEPFWLVLDSADTVIDTLADGTFTQFFPSFLVIGSNGAGEGVAFDFRSGGDAGVVCFDMTNADLAESIRPLAASFTGLLALAGVTGA